LPMAESSPALPNRMLQCMGRKRRERRPRRAHFTAGEDPAWARHGRQRRGLAGARGDGPSDHHSRRWRHGKKEGSEAKLTERKKTGRRRLGDDGRRGGADELSGGSLPRGGCGSASENGAGRGSRGVASGVGPLLKAGRGVGRSHDARNRCGAAAVSPRPRASKSSVR
jgi:hypothetical protein